MLEMIVRIILLSFLFQCLVVDCVFTDQACGDIGGTCQDDSSKCDGSYYTGKCTGGNTRRCCSKYSTEYDAGYCSDIAIVSRDSWGARRPIQPSKLHNPVPYFFIHHTAGHECHTFQECVHQMKGIQNYHMDGRHYYDIGYSFLVGQDGRVYEGRGFQREGAHTKHYNSVGLATSFIGNFMDHIPNNKSQQAVKTLIKCGVEMGYIDSNYSLYGHRDVGTTACPGDAFYHVVQTWPHYSTHKPTS